LPPHLPVTTEVTGSQQRGAATLLAEARELDTAGGDDALDLLDHAPGRPARPRRPGRHPGSGCCRTCPGWTWPPRATPRRCQGPARPAGQRPAGGGTRSAARCPASSSPPPCRQTGSAEQPGGSNRQLGRSKSPTTSTAGPGDEAEQSKLRSSRASAFLPSGIAPTGLAPRGPRTQQQRRLPRRAPLALACAQGLADTGQRSTGPRPGGLDPRPDPGQDPADQRQNQDREQPTTKSHGQEHDPRLPGAATRHTRPHPSATSAVPDPESASVAAPPSRGRRRRTAAVGGRQQRVPTPE